MCKINNSLTVSFSLSFLILVVAFVMPQLAIGQTKTTATASSPTSAPPASVNVVNTPNVSVTNTPNVSITNTPNVNIASMPSVTLASGATVNVAGTPNVSIANTTAAPIPVRDVDNAARNAFTPGSLFQIWSAGVTALSFSYTVPAGKRLVLEQVSVEALVQPSSSQKVSVEAQTLAAGVSSSFFFTTQDVLSLGGKEVFQGSSQMRSYADAGSTVEIGVLRNDQSGGTSDKAFVFVSGYLVDVP